MKVSEIIERIVYNNGECKFSKNELDSAMIGAETALEIAGIKLEHDIDYFNYSYEGENGWYAYYLEYEYLSRTGHNR